MISTESRVIVTTWSCPSSSASRVCSMNAATSEPRKFSPSPRPTTSGELRRAATTRVGSRASTATSVNAPSSWTHTRCMATVRSTSDASCSSSSWAATSVSVSETRPSCSESASIRARSSAKFSMIPLCTSATRRPKPRCGCALTSLGAPWVAQRVCPMPVVDVAAARRRWPSRGWRACRPSSRPPCRVGHDGRSRRSRSRGTPAAAARRVRRPGPAWPRRTRRSRTWAASLSAPGQRPGQAR